MLTLEGSSAYLLHARPYRNTSLLLELWTPDEGRVSVVARGAREAKRNWRPLLQPFIPLWVVAMGKGELLTLKQVESHRHLPALVGESLLCGFYLNELLIRTLQHFDPHPVIYEAYDDTLAQLSQKGESRLLLRRFEKILLTELGYAPRLDQEAESSVPIDQEAYYRFVPQQGVLRWMNPTDFSHPELFKGSSLQALHAEQWAEMAAPVLRDAKRLFQLAMGPLLGTRPLQSRRLLQSFHSVCTS